MENQNEESVTQEALKLSPEEFDQVVDVFATLSKWRDQAIANGTWNPKPSCDNSSDNKAE